MFKKFNWGHGIVLALASFIGFILFMIFIFPSDQQNSELVSNNYYEDELNYQKVIDAKKNAATISEKPVYQQTSAGIKLTFPISQTPDGKKIDFQLYRTDDSNLDIKKQEILNAENSVTIPAKVLSKGSYTLKLHWLKNKTPYQLDYDVQWN